MELPQPRPIGTEGKKATHDFLSLYSPVQQDPRPAQGGHLKTHDFLQPLEEGRTRTSKEDNKVKVTTVEKPPPPAPPSVEHFLPGGIGTYTISHISYISQRVPKPEGAAQEISTDRNEENSNSSSYTGSGFTLWEESVAKKGKTGKENMDSDGRHVMRDMGMKIGGGQWTSSERSSQSFSNHSHHSNMFSSLSSSQPPSAQKNQSFMQLINSAKGGQEEEDDDDDDDFNIKNDSSHQKSNLTVKIEGKCNDQRANTPRSKHSATEQRRRSKINDRFQKLRALIPNSDQKRDKASFLLEVIEYIQFLQEKVHKYEGSYPGWNHEPPKLMPWGNSNKPAEGFADQFRGTNGVSGTVLTTNGVSGPVLSFPVKFDENIIIDSPAIPRSGQNPVESDMSTATTFKAMDYNSGAENKEVPLLLQPNFPPGRSSSAPLPPRLAPDTENIAAQSLSQLWQGSSRMTDCTLASDKLKQQDLAIDSGTISISSVYSEGLLNTLTQALQTSGVDLSKASISVQIDLGKQANSRLDSSTPIVKNDDVPARNQAMAHSRLVSTREESDQAFKRLKTGRS
ncbi:unnamed protein product [Ilex paraguariensis]|uniref:BHLH domain-containing protein n=1 Tax=Ilex paraguariensis TaxID=185542 RepID=A0ABC8RTU2_9AQUA